MTIKTKSIFDDKAEDDGVRVLVSRFYPRFLKEPKWDHWLKDLGPLPEHLMKYKNHQWTEEQLEAAYLKYLDSHYSHASNIVTLDLAQLTKFLVAGEIITLLCYEKEQAGVFCHRHILKRYLEKRLEKWVK